MRSKILLTVLLAATAAGCSSLLDVDPVNEIVEESAIVDPPTARAAASGIYDALQAGEYYGGDFVWFGDLSAEDVNHTGTFTTYRQADQNNLTADNSSIEDIWDDLYTAIGRANIVIEKVPAVEGLEPEEIDNIVGEALLIRALTFHNLLKFWGERDEDGLGIPLRIQSAGSVGEASDISRATTREVYDQILADLALAATKLTQEDVTRATKGAAKAIEARVRLYREDWAGAETAAQAVVDMGYELATDFRDLFDADGIETTEDIFKVAFTPVEYSWEGYYYLPYEEGGRGEIGPTLALIRAFDPGYVPGNPATFDTPDVRAQESISFLEETDAPYAIKWPTGIGAEDVHVIRFAEVLLIKAEAEARLNKLDEAIETLNPIRVRAGLAALDATGMTQPQVLDAILHERRLELAMEGDRWPDLVRRGVAQAVVGFPADRAFQVLYPIPLGEIDVVPNLQQNTGY